MLPLPSKMGGTLAAARGAGFPSPLLLGLNQGGVCVRVWRLERFGDPPPWLVTSSNPILACFPTARLERCAQGHAGHGEFGSLWECALSSWDV